VKEMKKYLLLFAVLLLVTGASFAQSQKPLEKKTFVYVIHIVPKYLDPTTWDQKVIMDHMGRLKTLFDEGTLLHAGRTEQLDDKTFGIVIYYAESLEKAREIANADPGVMAGMMTVDVFPYWNVLMKDPAK